MRIIQIIVKTTLRVCGAGAQIRRGPADTNTAKSVTRDATTVFQ